MNMRAAHTIIALLICTVLFGATAERKVTITTLGHPCAACSRNLKRAIIEANPGATNIQMNDTTVTFTASPGAVNWTLLRKKFREADRPITDIQLCETGKPCTDIKEGTR